MLETKTALDQRINSMISTEIKESIAHAYANHLKETLKRLDLPEMTAQDERAFQNLSLGVFINKPDIKTLLLKIIETKTPITIPANGIEHQKAQQLVTLGLATITPENEGRECLVALRSEIYQLNDGSYKFVRNGTFRLELIKLLEQLHNGR